MKRSLVVSMLFLLAGPCLAGEPVDPVKEILATAENNWKPNSEYQDYFSDDRLDTLFSQDFADAYREAAIKAPAYDVPEGETGSPFDYDPIVNAQDACPLADMEIREPVADGDAFMVETMFSAVTCMNDIPDVLTVTRYRVIEEEGEFVIDDITQIVANDPLDPVKSTLKALVKG